jgi:hypothetical protein
MGENRISMQQAGERARVRAGGAVTVEDAIEAMRLRWLHPPIDVRTFRFMPPGGAAPEEAMSETKEESAERIADHRSARLACEMARNLLAQYDFDALIQACNKAEAAAPLLDPTLWMKKGRAMEEDREVFARAEHFLAAWKR